ncbi:Repeat domain-containing protein [Chitinophaga costaii]|uniref:Repeat domain-containing protein n=2 Tax=Chitinophaga costaii TaxID=1335309 RepID=A0A1C4BFX6_9BACT|nr:Repeat domain-containing protein [Chitinophaga costaii]
MALASATWIMAAVTSGCHSPKIKKQGIENGKEMAEQYCGNCHQFVPPTVLDSATWKLHVLPNMAGRLGIRVWGESEYYPPSEGDHPTIDFSDWLDLVAYYTHTAPKQMDTAKLPQPFVKDWAVFKLTIPAVADTNMDATTCMVAWDTASSHLYTGTEETKLLNVYEPGGKLLHFFRMHSPVVHYSQYRNPATDTVERMFTTIGQIIATDQSRGEEILFNPEKEADPDYDIVAAFQPRPVQALPGDFNKDGLTDYIVCGFGHEQGALLRMQQKTGHKFDVDTIKSIPGAEQAQAGDFNNDGWPDVMVLFAHAQEGISLFLNNQHGGFTEKRLLDFMPVWGSTSFQYVDVNHDGQPDIVYTCGDNADYSTVLKPFHGVYVFLNKGNFKFEKAYFFPIHGCYKAMVADFDGDGDMDIATIAFFSDYINRPEEGMVYFEQDKPMHFIPHAIPVANMGRWICMDVADYDHDGDLDIFLGNFSKGLLAEGVKVPWNTRQPYIILENKIK